MKSKGKKKEELDALKKELSDAKNLFVAQFQGMTVAQDAELRHKVRQAKGKYRVVKNTLAKKAAEGTAAESVSKSFDGSTAIAYNANDPVSLAKALTAYAKANPLFVFKAGVVEGRVINLAIFPSLRRCLRRKNSSPNCSFYSMRRRNVLLSR